MDGVTIGKPVNCWLRRFGVREKHFPTFIAPEHLQAEQGFIAAGAPELAAALHAQFFDLVMDLGVEGMMISHGYPYQKALDQQHFLHRQRSHQLFRQILDNPRPRWRFNLSPPFLRFLQGIIDYDRTPWGMPS